MSCDGPLRPTSIAEGGPRRIVLGTELAGEIEAVGRAVTTFKVHDAVFAFPGLDMGCHAEYRVVPEDARLVLMPAGVSFEEASCVDLVRGSHGAPLPETSRSSSSP